MYFNYVIILQILLDINYELYKIVNILAKKIATHALGERQKDYFIYVYIKELGKSVRRSFRSG